MNRFFFMLWVALLIDSQSRSIQAQITIGGTLVDTSTVISGIDIPWTIIWGPDNHIWMTERFGRVSRVNPQTGQQQVLLTLSDCQASGESGLLGMALHPSFADTPWVYLVYTYLTGSSIRERLVRYNYNETAGQLTTPEILLNDIPGNTTHNGSRLLFLPDRSLLMTTGDAQIQSAPLSTQQLPGKVLRMLPDGSVPADNPFPGNLVYTFGHRNAQGMFLHPLNGKVYISEHGPTTDDEVNVLAPGGNYGWPTVAGYCDQPTEIQYCAQNNVREPIIAWTPTIAPAGMMWYNHSSLPVFRNKILLTTLKNARLYVLSLQNDTGAVVSEVQYLTNWYGRLRDVCSDPAGNLYLATNGNSWSNTQPFTHRIVKIAPRNTTSVPTDPDATQKLNINPNPFTSETRVEVPAEWIGRTLEWMEPTGRIVATQSIEQEIFHPKMTSMASGIYFVRVNNTRSIIKIQINNR
ncbi:MAG: PQQ-dependent sugar dehydrogenase [Sphingomonadales bacterium]|nr:PQQ-dependent sugar dehydrogenase [Sphingomonadales bacterium]